MKTLVTKSGHKVIQILSGRSNVFIINNGKVNLLVDTSPGYRWKSLLKSLNHHGIKNIEYLILTHSHFDHAGNAKRIKFKYGCKIIIHRDESSRLMSGEIFIPEGTNPFTRFIVHVLAPRFIRLLECEPCIPDILTEEEFDLSQTGINARIIHTPGHSPGSVTIIIDEEIALVGDTMFGIFRRSVFPPYADNVRQLLISWSLLLKTKCEIFIPSHGGIKRRSQLMNDFKDRTSANPDYVPL